MHSYEHRTKRNQPWQQCDREEALTILAPYGREAEKVLSRIDAGETVSGSDFHIRKYDPGTAPLQPRFELQVEADGDILYVKTRN